MTIVLDLIRDRYQALPAGAMRTLSALAEWSAGEKSAAPVLLAETPLELTGDVIGRLIRLGILTHDERLARRAPPRSLQAKARFAMDENEATVRGLHLSDLGRFVGACATTLWRLRARSLHHAVICYERSKQRQAADAALDIASVADLVAIFRRLRSFTFRAQGRCLFQGLALVNFLSRYGVYPELVLGVKLEPWAAHCWVQLEEQVLDGTPEQTRFFTPILTV